MDDYASLAGDDWKWFYHVISDDDVCECFCFVFFYWTAFLDPRAVVPLPPEDTAEREQEKRRALGFCIADL